MVCCKNQTVLLVVSFLSMVQGLRGACYDTVVLRMHLVFSEACFSQWVEKLPNKNLTSRKTESCNPMNNVMS